jgi:hypothetical protein
MTAVAGDIASSYNAKAGKRDRLTLKAVQVIGAAGAVGALTADDAGITVAKDAGTGVYNITFPKALAASVSVDTIYSPAATVKSWWLVAYSAAAGTAQIAIGNGGGTATDPASGDELHLRFVLDTRSDS